LHRGPFDEGPQHPLHVREVGCADQLASPVEAQQVAHPGQGGDVGDGVAVAHDPGAVGQAPVQHGQQAARLGHVAVAWALVLEALGVGSDYSCSRSGCCAGHLRVIGNSFSEVIGASLIRQPDIVGDLGEARLR
jgi:hypothetical protein